MENNDFLHPISYHLRDFGQYQWLDLSASQAGNLTLLGANAVGKTTLANSWFPVLVDGSIATPSFNPARSSDAITQSTRPRNTLKDKRTFSSMLLGWGASAFKVRTGYTYMTLKSNTRQVVLGIGAHRQSDGLKSQTWWFVLESKSVDDLVCVDGQGLGLDKEAFSDANAGFGQELVIFKRWEDYRSFVAVNIYGFDSGETLGKLANAYRLLASPILTGGNARFAPIPIALREAQEPIDRDQIIQPLAESQRQLNRTKALQQELENGQKRLDKIKLELFWGNLNRLAESSDSMLNTHLKQAKALTQAKEAVRAANAAINQLTEQLRLIKENQVAAAAKLETLQAAVAKQQVIEETRRSLDHQIADLQKRQAICEKQQQDLAELEETVQQAQVKLAALVSRGQQIQTEQLDPVIAQLHGQSANMGELTGALAQTEQKQMIQSLADYLATHQRLVKEYKHLSDAITRTSEDIALVQGMQGKMDTAIDRRATGMLVKTVNAALHQDNRDIHEQGAATMNTAVATLQQQRHALIDHAPDLAVLLADPERLDQLAQLSKQASGILDLLNQNSAAQKLSQAKLDGQTAQRDQLVASIDPNFSPEQAQTTIAELTAQRNGLKIDPTLGQQLDDQQKKGNDLQKTATDLQVKQGQQQGIMTTQTGVAQTAQQELQAVDARLTAALAVLKAYTPEGIQLDGITALLDFVHGNRAVIRRHPFGDVGGKVRDAIDGGENSLALDELFSQRGTTAIATAIHEERTTSAAELTVVPFDLGQAQSVLKEDITAVAKSVDERSSGQNLALETYINAAVMSISQQYAIIPEYNQMLTEGTDPDGIRLHIKLLPLPGSTEPAIAEARDLQASARPALAKLVEDRINRLVEDVELASDDEAFIDKAVELLDTRLWSKFEITINRKNSDEEEVVDDTFVQSGGSGAEKAQAMVLPLLLVPKMRLRLAGKADAPHLVMFDEFADKLDPETAKAFAQTISRFGFNFIATMPSGGQTKLLADGVANRAYEVLAPKRKDGKFHANQVHEVLSWHPEVQHE
ncbi:SbcC/MukB-like Walker B domain-containing protein [Lacticaseibacillus jixianensis]|uniref:SbcC/MukB-like Walker B domain-containing protein n=1 Tax=Lacticaseibacillus jixianensis TaxID=2486012 RepID=A0ABW4B5U3_9LACO|nr:SbcC/MukB-like Walker B domain-containing protein [Lacticaseibacillus jixianensis]